MRLRKPIQALMSIGLLFTTALIIGLFKRVPFPLLLLRSATATLVLVSILLVGYGLIRSFLPDLWNALNRRLMSKKRQVAKSHPLHQKEMVGQKINIVVDDSSPSTTATPTIPPSEKRGAKDAVASSSLVAPTTGGTVERYINSIASADPEAVAQAIRAMISNSIIIKG